MHTDIPTRGEIERLLAVRGPVCVTAYLPTNPVTREAAGDRIAFKNLAAQADARLEQAGASAADRRALAEAFDDLDEDDEFWALQANSLAVFATPDRIRTFRLANALTESLSVADRFDLKPLMRSVSFPNAAFVLALASGSARLLEVAADMPTFEVPVAEMPSDAASAAGKASITDRSPMRRLQGSEGQKVRLRQYARKVDAALRGVLAGLDLPLILAAAPPLDSIFRSVNSYPHLAERGIAGNPEDLGDDELTEKARAVLDELYAAELDALRDLFEARAARGRGASDLGDVARAATFGAVDTLLVDIDAHLPGTIDDETGAIQPADSALEGYGVTDEIVRRTLAAGGRVVAVRAADLPSETPAAAILRYPA